MLTRLRVRGFKNLLDVDIRFGPFTCIAGANGVGKSNLFDAIHFLHLLTKNQVMEAAQKIRDTSGRSAEPNALFTAFGAFRAPEIRFVADLLVDQNVRDDFGVPARAAISSLRYEIAFALDEQDGVQRLQLIHESLNPIPIHTARKGIGFPTKKEFLETSITGRRTKPFISTESVRGVPEITVHQEGHGGRKVPAANSSRTVIGGLASSEFPTVLAVHREMESWKTLLLELSAMRAPSLYRDPRVLDSRGANLPAAIHRLQKQEDRPGRISTTLVNQLAKLLEDVQELRLRSDDKTEMWTVEIRGRDGVFHPARSLSDGTLRFLVLTVLSQDPETKGIICLEEPENGIHPEKIKAMVELLRDMAVDPHYPVDEDNTFRQVVVNTHSPLVVKHIGQDELVYFCNVQIARSNQHGRVAAVRVPPRSWRAKNCPGSPRLAPGDLLEYLGNAVDGWLAMTYHENGNGQTPEVYSGERRAK